MCADYDIPHAPLGHASLLPCLPSTHAALRGGGTCASHCPLWRLTMLQRIKAVSAALDCRPGLHRRMRAHFKTLGPVSQPRC